MHFLARRSMSAELDKAFAALEKSKGYASGGLPDYPYSCSASQSPQPHLADGTTFRPRRPTTLDNIEHLQP